MIQNKARTWKQRLKLPVEPQNTIQCQNPPTEIANFGWRAAAAGQCHGLCPHVRGSLITVAKSRIQNPKARKISEKTNRKSNWEPINCCHNNSDQFSLWKLPLSFARVLSNARTHTQHLTSALSQAASAERSAVKRSMKKEGKRDDNEELNCYQVFQFLKSPLQRAASEGALAPELPRATRGTIAFGAYTYFFSPKICANKVISNEKIGSKLNFEKL